MPQPSNPLENPLGYYQPGIDPDPAANDEYFKAQLRDQFDSIMHTAQTYGTVAGKKELERLRKATIESAAWMPSIAMQHSIDAATAHAFAREGQNGLVRDIEQRLELAKKVKTPDDLFDIMKGTR